MPHESCNQAYRQALAFLLSRIDYERLTAMPYTASRLNLDRMERLLVLLGNPHHGLNVVHIAGTKGKGSTSYMLAAILEAAGYRTGLYTSPHLERFEERFVINGQIPSESQFVRLLDRVRPAVQQMDQLGPAMQPTCFEILTGMGFLYFRESGVDLAVIEVGLGGRLDSTNVCRPVVSIITSISLDHTRQLGNTLASIATEKSGIIKPGIPVISGVRGGEAAEVIAETASARGSPLISIGKDFDYAYRPPRLWEHAACDDRSVARVDYWRFHGTSRQPYWQDVPLALLGQHQGANAAMAIRAAELLSDKAWPVSHVAIHHGLSRVKCPGRIEVLGTTPAVVLDTAHNVASVEALLAVLRESFLSQRRLAVFAATRGKDVRGMLKRLASEFALVILTQYTSNPRYCDPQDLYRHSEQLRQEDTKTRMADVHVVPDPQAAWRLARALAQPTDLIVVTGSFYLAGELRPTMIRDLSAECLASAAPMAPP